MAKFFENEKSTTVGMGIELNFVDFFILLRVKRNHFLWDFGSGAGNKSSLNVTSHLFRKTQCVILKTLSEQILMV